jgi:hypothetical protein
LGKFLKFLKQPFDSYVEFVYRKPSFKGIIEDKTPLVTKPLTSRAIKKLKAQEPPRCFSSLENTSKVTDPIVKRNSRKQQQPDVAPKPTTGTIQIFKDYKKKKPAEFKKDIWDAEKVEEKGEEWFGIALQRHHLKETVFVAPKIILDKRNKIKTIETPVVGSSYNPSEKEFKTLVDKTIQRESAIIKKQARYANSLKPVYASFSKNQLKRRRREEMTQGLPHTDNEPEEQYEGTATIPVVNKKKDLRKKRKQKEERLRQAKAKKAKLELQKLKDLRK